MPHTLQGFLAEATRKAATELAAAFLRIPEDRRSWSPEEKARTAVDLVAECAILNGYTAELIHTHTWNASRFDGFLPAKAEAVTWGWDRLHALLQENAGKVVEAIGAVPDEALSTGIEMPWGTQTLAEIAAYPYWNMSYHLGQINYIASMLGCLE